MDAKTVTSLDTLSELGALFCAFRIHSPLLCVSHARDREDDECDHGNGDHLLPWRYTP